MNILTYPVSAGVVGFESPAAEYKQLELSLDELLVEHPSSTF
ncbi:DNA polymerase V protein UmuD (fragment) [Vibrio crassostreae]